MTMYRVEISHRCKSSFIYVGEYRHNKKRFPFKICGFLEKRMETDPCSYFPPPFSHHFLMPGSFWWTKREYRGLYDFCFWKQKEEFSNKKEERNFCFLFFVPHTLTPKIEVDFVCFPSSSLFPLFVKQGKNKVKL